MRNKLVFCPPSEEGNAGLNWVSATNPKRESADYSTLVFCQNFDEGIAGLNWFFLATNQMSETHDKTSFMIQIRIA